MTKRRSCPHGDLKRALLVGGAHIAVLAMCAIRETRKPQTATSAVCATPLSTDDGAVENSSLGRITGYPEVTARLAICYVFPDRYCAINRQGFTDRIRSGYLGSPDRLGDFQAIDAPR